MRRYAQKGDYKPIADSPCLNLVTATIDYYRRSPKRLKVIYLNHTHWRLFVDDLKRLMSANGDNEGFVIDAQRGVPIENSDVVVKRGSQFQNKEMQYEFYNDVELKVENFSKVTALA